MRAIEQFARRCVVLPIILLGIGLSFLSEWCVRFGAWVDDVDFDEPEDER